jgi:uncharacterized damage-inducible protein DinB
MRVDADLLRRQLEYSFYASEAVLKSLRSVKEEDLLRNLGNSHGGLLDSLVHIFQADRVWLSRVLGDPLPALAKSGESWTLDTLHSAWREVAAQWLAWAGSLDDAEAKLAYRNLRGEPFEMPLWQVVFHVVNHGTYHRGQITTMLRQLGYTPAPTDLHTFYLSGRT